MRVERLFEVRFPADPGRLKIVRGMVERAAMRAGCGESVAAQVVIAVNEACMNVIQHAYHGDASQEIGLCLSSTGGELVCRIEDSAPPLDPAAIRPRRLDDVRPGGLGTHFITELMDECHYGHLEGGRGNYLEMRKRIS
jgi:anti-sigma regulatory factor (Ser/Thr protein kinase)